MPGEVMRMLRPGRVAAAALLLFGTLTASAAQAGAEAPFVEDNVLFQQKTEGYSCFRILAVVRATNGEVLAFAEGRVADCGDTATSTSCCAGRRTAGRRGDRCRWSPTATAVRTATRCRLSTG